MIHTGFCHNEIPMLLQVLATLPFVGVWARWQWGRWRDKAAPDSAAPDSTPPN